MATETSAAIPTDSVAGDQLRAFIERLERLNEEAAGIAGDIKDIYSEAKSAGFCAKTIRKIVALRKKDYAERQEEEALLELYLKALGELADTPLGRAAVSRHVAGRGH